MGNPSDNGQSISRDIIAGSIFALLLVIVMGILVALGHGLPYLVEWITN